MVNFSQFGIISWIELKVAILTGLLEKIDFRVWQSEDHSTIEQFYLIFLIELQFSLSTVDDN